MGLFAQGRPKVRQVRSAHALQLQGPGCNGFPVEVQGKGQFLDVHQSSLLGR
jgi:hypothetical protein